MNRLASEDGFTLAELLVGAVLMIIVMSASLTTLDQLRRLGTRTDDRVALQDEARQVSRQLTRSLRNIAPSPAIPTVIERAGAYDLVFRSVDRPRDSGQNTRNLRRVRYCLDTSNPNNARLLEQTQRWTYATPPAAPSSPDCPGVGWDSTVVAADQLTNNAGGTDRALWSYKERASGEITGVTLNLFMNAKPESRELEVELQTGVFLRNQNRAPTAVFTAAPAGLRHVLLNASPSSDPEGDPLDYAWFANGVQVGSGLIFDYTAPAGGSYVFRLDVRDPSGLLSQSPTQTVVLP
jgi:type II secretory pathway pseudopilin PulG